MNPRPKRLPRLWCALQGLLPLEECIASQHAKLAWLRLDGMGKKNAAVPQNRRNPIAGTGENMNVPRRGPLRNQS